MILNNIYGKLEKMTSRWGVIMLFLLAHSMLLLMMVFTFPKINAKFETLAFDLKTFGYSNEESILMLGKLDQSTIDSYIFPQLFFLDLLYPLLLALFLSVLIIKLSNLVSKKSNKVYSNLFLLPFIAMLVDYFENIMIFKIITSPLDEVSSSAINFASLCTQLKSLFTTLSWVTILALLVIWFIKKWKSRNYSAEINN